MITNSLSTNKARSIRLLKHRGNLIQLVLEGGFPLTVHVCWFLNQLYHSCEYILWIHWFSILYFDGLVQQRRNSIANALELRLSCTNPSICGIWCYQGLVTHGYESTRSLLVQIVACHPFGAKPPPWSPEPMLNFNKLCNSISPSKFCHFQSIKHISLNIFIPTGELLGEKINPS